MLTRRRRSARPISTRRAAPVAQGPVRVDHVVDRHRHYPGELVTYHTRLCVEETQPYLTLRLSIPAGLHLESHRASPEIPGASLYTEDEGGVQTLVWRVGEPLEAGIVCEHEVRARVAPLGEGARLVSRAQALGEGGAILSEERAVLVVEASGRYVRYLPSIYAGDELMGRFLMLFESFWAPVEMQIGGADSYFDPALTPSAFLPWLASWLGASLDPRLPEACQRTLIRSALSLYRRRGTRAALQEFLEIYTGGEVRIVEHRAQDLRLGSESRLGQAIALGIGNRPHTFTVHVRLPQSGWLGTEGQDKDWVRRTRQLLGSIIEAEKPAHAGYRLRIELDGKGEIA